MRVVPAALHRVLDFVTIAIFALAPTVLHLTGVPMMVAYALAVVHLILTLLTRFTPTGAGVVPFKLHGVVELIVGIALVVAPFVLGWTGVARTFFAAMGVLIFVVWALSDYATEAARVG